jgi:hypothetical protein
MVEHNEDIQEFGEKTDDVRFLTRPRQQFTKIFLPVTDRLVPDKVP